MIVKESKTKQTNHCESIEIDSFEVAEVKFALNTLETSVSSVVTHCSNARLLIKPFI